MGVKLLWHVDDNYRAEIFLFTYRTYMQDTFIFVDLSRDEYASLIRGMYSPRVQILFATSIPEMFRLVPAAKQPFIIVGLPTDESSDKFVEQFLKLSRLEEFCFIFVGKDIQRLEGRIGKVLPHSMTLNFPATGDDVMGLVDYLRSHQQAIKETARKPVARNVKTSAETIAAPIEPSLIAGISKLCFQALQQLEPKDLSLSCSAIFRAREIGDLREFTYLPSDPRVKAVVENITQVAGEKGAAHLHRSAAVSSRMLNALDIDVAMREAARNAAMLFSWSFVDNPQFFTTDYLLAGRSEIRRKFAELVSQSSEKMSAELGLKNEQKIVDTISRLIGDDYRVGDQAHDLISSTIMTSDLVDRVCWANGHWDPQGVHQLMHRFSGGDVPDIHPQVLAITLKSLCEALEGMGSNLLRARALVQNPELEQLVLPDEITRAAAKNEKQVLLSRLLPGMKTSRPVLTFDGRTIVSRNTLLDEDLIWRLWQIAAVRPLNPVHVLIK